MSLAERLIPSLPIVLSPWQRGSFLPPSLLSYILGRGSFLRPYCLISLAERLISSLPVISSTSGTPGALVPAREQVSVDKLGDQGRGFTAQSDCSSVMSLVSVITKGVHHHNDSSACASACQSVAVMRATPRRGRRFSVMLRRRLLRGWILRPEILQQCSVSAPTVDTAARASPCPLPSASPGSRGPLSLLLRRLPPRAALDVVVTSWKGKLRGRTVTQSSGAVRRSRWPSLGSLPVPGDTDSPPYDLCGRGKATLDSFHSEILHHWLQCSDALPSVATAGALRPLSLPSVAGGTHSVAMVGVAVYDI